MKRCCGAICILALLWICPSLARADATLRVGFFTKMPVAMAPASGRPSGLVVDILSDIAQKQGWTLTWVHGSFSEGVNRLDIGEIDLMVPIAYTPARDDFLDFTTEAFLQSWGCLFTQRGSSLRSIPDVEGKRIAYVQRSMLFNAFNKLLQGFQVECEWKVAQTELFQAHGTAITVAVIGRDTPVERGAEQQAGKQRHAEHCPGNGFFHSDTSLKVQ